MIAVERAHMRLLSSEGPVLVEVVKRDGERLLLRACGAMFWARVASNCALGDRFWATVELSGDRLTIRPIPYAPKT